MTARRPGIVTSASAEPPTLAVVNREVGNAESVSGDPIRALLASVQPSGFIDRTPGTVAVLRSRVEEAGGDPDAVAEWVKAHGGHVDRTQSYRRGGVGERYGGKETYGKEFYVVPTEALAR